MRALIIMPPLRRQDRDVTPGRVNQTVSRIFISHRRELGAAESRWRKVRGGTVALRHDGGGGGSDDQ